ncbi:MAG: hypothetical protein SGI71_05020, partial [Verrucomicrobiota bacterium]|nr:hypothetical protein [Verrucomicrobiota bacterium]
GEWPGGPAAIPYVDVSESLTRFENPAGQLQLGPVSHRLIKPLQSPYEPSLSLSQSYLDTYANIEWDAAKTTAFQTGVNITPRSVANNYRTIGRGGRTFVTESSAVECILGPLKGNRISITGQQARQLENALGLNPNSLEARNILSIVDNVPGRVPRVPTSGNSLFQGAGAGLPGGGAELTIQGIPSAGGQGIRQIILEVIK